MKINTKLEALKLIYDPCKLFSLLYSKYGNIDEDLFLYFSNQLLYNKNSHFNILFKEIQYENKYQENLKKFYKYSETLLRLPKLSDYYKNYHLFFCKPNLNNFKFLKILRNYEDNKAEIFYKENYSDSTISTIEKNKKIEKIEIFDKKTRKIIEETKNNKKQENIIKNNIKNNVNNKIQENINNSTLTLDSINSYKYAILNNNFNNDFSFYDSVKNLINCQDKKENNLQKFKTNRSRVKKSSSTTNISNKNTNSINSVYKTYAISKNKEKMFLSPKNNKNSFNLKHSMDNINIEKFSKIQIENLKRTLNSNINNFNKLSNNLKIKSNIKKVKNKTEEINSFSNTKNISNNLKKYYFVSKFSIMKNSLKKLMNSNNNYSLKNLSKKNTSNTNRSKNILLTPSISLPKFSSINNSNKQISYLINKSNLNKNISSKITLKESRNEKRIKNEISNNNSTKKKNILKNYKNLSQQLNQNNNNNNNFNNSKFSFFKYNSNLLNKNKSKINFHSQNQTIDRENSKSNFKNNNNSSLSNRKLKPINVNLNKNLKMKIKEKKNNFNKINRLISPTK